MITITMNAKTFAAFLIYCTIALSSLAALNCGKNYDNAVAAITAFIIGAEQHDMGKLWNMLGPEAQAFYNDLGEKQRRSGRGALEREINNIKTFRSLKNDYRLKEDKDSPGTVKIILLGAVEYPVATIKDGETYKIKDGPSVRNLLNGIAFQKNQKDDY
jgi:hypothetical protein